MSEAPSSTSLRIGVIGGTGAEGSGLAWRWAQAGHAVFIGSRDGAKAAAAAAEMNTRLGRDAVRGGSNAEAVADCDIAVLSVPFAAQMSTAIGLKDALAGKILVDVTVPLVPPKVGTVQLPLGGSCVVALQVALGESVKVVSAFQNVGSHHFASEGHAIECDVLVCGDSREARDRVVSLVESAGLRGIHAGPLANSAAAEALTSVLIFINRTYKVSASGIRITGIDGLQPAPLKKGG